MPIEIVIIDIVRSGTMIMLVENQFNASLVSNVTVKYAIEQILVSK